MSNELKCLNCGNLSAGVIGASKYVSKDIIEHYCVVCGATSYHKVIEQ